MVLQFEKTPFVMVEEAMEAETRSQLFILHPQSGIRE